MIWSATKEGLKKALKTCLKIIKIYIPVYFAVALLKYIGVLEMISNFFSPIMTIFGLPGNCALVLLLANGVNIYACLGVVSQITLTLKQLTIVATMVCLSHTLPIETSIIKSLNIPRFVQIIIRLSLSIIVGIVMNLVWC